MRQMKTAMMIVSLAAILWCSTGCCLPCMNWQKQYEDCESEKANLESLLASTQAALDQCNAERDQMAGQLGQSQKNLQEAMKKAGFNPGFTGEETSWDPAKGTITVTLATDVFFDSGKATLKSSARSRLNRIARVIQEKYGGKEISVVGHTDTDPIKKSKWQDNWQLSAERALAVTRYLIEQGLLAKRLAAAGRSQYHPVSNEKAKNRRVEIVVHMFQ